MNDAFIYDADNRVEMIFGPGDIQFVNPGIGALTAGDDAFIYGVRVNLRL